jgi:citrate synthase
MKDGTVHEIPIILSNPHIICLLFLGSFGEKYIDIRNLYPQTNMFMFDPGFTITASCASSITYSNAEGRLLYRGYKIEDLAAKSTFTEVCFLLLYGKLPTLQELDKFENKM